MSDVHCCHFRGETSGAGGVARARQLVRWSARYCQADQGITNFRISRLASSNSSNVMLFTHASNACTSRRRFLQLAGAAAPAAMPWSALALHYPTRPVRFVLGFSAGGLQDIMARLIRQWLSERLRAPLLIQERSA